MVGGRESNMYERGLVERRLATRRRGARNVVQANHAVHAVLYLVRVFVNGSARMRRRQREYMGRRVIVVYVGAIAVLFRFVVMMLNLSGAEGLLREESEEGSASKEDPLREDSVGLRRMARRGRSGAHLLEEEVNQVWLEKVDWVYQVDPMGSMNVRGQVRYTHGIYYVIRAGRVLLVGMRGAIVLTLQTGQRGSHRTWKRQQLNEQRSRDSDKALMRVAHTAKGRRSAAR